MDVFPHKTESATAVATAPHTPEKHAETHDKKHDVSHENKHDVSHENKHVDSHADKPVEKHEMKQDAKHEMKHDEKHAESHTPKADGSSDAHNMGHNGNPAQSEGRVSAKEQNAHPGASIEAEGDGGDTADHAVKTHKV